MKTYVIGDIHGEFERLEKCLQSVNFDFENDKLIQLGDIVDRGHNSFKCVELLLKIKNLIAIRGNHDECFRQGLYSGEYLLMNEGCLQTLQSYIENCNPERKIFNSNYIGETTFIKEDMPIEHLNFFNNQLPYYIDENNNLFIHGGFNRHRLIEDETDKTIFWWDRDFLHAVRSHSTMKDNLIHKFKTKNNFKEIFLGHTATTYFDSDTPLQFGNVWAIDTGSGKGGKLTILNIETKEFNQF